MFDAARFRALYALLAGDQTVDERGHAVDCGVRCGKYCCSPTKYLLPGERAFLEDEVADRADRFALVSLGFFDSIADDPSTLCPCEKLRDVRPFNCRIFPYSPRFAARDDDAAADDDAALHVVGLKKGTLKLFEPCWITTPAPAWEKSAIEAWQAVLDDDDNVAHFARLTTLWEWHQAVERGDEPGHVLGALAGIDHADRAEVRARARPASFRARIEIRARCATSTRWRATPHRHCHRRRRRHHRT